MKISGLLCVQNRLLGHQIYRWMYLMKYGTKCCYSTANLLVVHPLKHYSSAWFFVYSANDLHFEHLICCSD